jgi:hypothetical protein
MTINSVEYKTQQKTVSPISLSLQLSAMLVFMMYQNKNIQTNKPLGQSWNQREQPMQLMTLQQ